MEPNVVEKNDEEENDENVSNTSTSKFKLKGPRGWVHSLRKGVRGRAKEGFKSFVSGGIKKIFKGILTKKFLLFFVILAIAIFVIAIIVLVITESAHTKSESTVSSYISNSSTVSTQAKNAYEKSGTLVYMTDEDTKAIANKYLDTIEKTDNRLYEELSAENKIGDHKISDIPYAAGFNITNTYEFILNSEKMNFNRVNWKKYDRNTGEITKLETQTDPETNLKYPKNSEDTEKKISYFLGILTPYLQSHVISTAMMSGISTKSDSTEISNFVFQIIDKGYNVIDVLQYTLQTAKRDQTKKHYVKENVEITIYRKEYKCVAKKDELGEQTLGDTCVDFGYKITDLNDAKNQVKENYTEAHEKSTDKVEVFKNYTKVIEKQFVYPVTRADTLKKVMRAEYEQEKYSETDVSSYKNEDQKYEVKKEEFTNVEDTALKNFKEISIIDPDWVEAYKTPVNIEAGEYITTRYVWNDKLKEKSSEERAYTVDDVVEYINDVEDIAEGETVTLSATDQAYYESYADEDDLTRIDMLNAAPNIYSDYTKENYSENIGLSRLYLVFSYSLLDKYLAEIEAKKSTSWNSLSLGLLAGLDIIWPLDCAGYISSYFGVYRTDLQQFYGHGGVDITPTANLVYPEKRAYTGSLVYAASSGKVVGMFKETPRDQGNATSKCPDTAQGANYSCGGVSSYGRYVKIENETTGYSIIYGHLYEIADNIEIGSYVEQGQAIGVMGTTGSSTGVHLHFEVRNSSNLKVDPLQIVGVTTAREIIRNNQ